jgi:large subunit ribosomal protein L35
MPKMKSHRGAAKRFTRTGTGKIKRFKAMKSHILTTKTRKRKRNLRKSTLVAEVDVGRVEGMLPYL